ncbi:MAG: TIM barrel protein [Planctomycetes bacterium]|nr:TIM barrel protein [Planctomycetota bacterium]
MKTSPSPFTRRNFFKRAGGAAAAGLFFQRGSAAAGAEEKPSRPLLKLGLVTYNLARSWDIETIIKNCAEAKFEAVELLTSHAHGVEVSLSPGERKKVRARFESSPVKLASLGSAFEFHSADPQEVRRNIEGAKEYSKLAAEVGAPAIKVRPNGLQVKKGIPEEATLNQIGEALAEVGAAAAQNGIEVRVEVHGEGTSRLPNIQKILDASKSGNVFVCWNSNQSDLLDGGLKANFELVKGQIRFVHMRELYLEEYPFRQLLSLLRGAGYKGYCCAEIPESADPVRVMKYYRGLFLAYQDLI